MADVVSLHGGLTGEPKVSDALVEVLEDLLERARSGDVCGALVVPMYCDGTSSFILAGRVGGYTQLGAATAGVAVLTDIARERD